MPRTMLYVSLALYALVTAARLPQWRSDLSVWTAAAWTDADDPWALNNTAHYLHLIERNKDAAPYWHHLVRLRRPEWLPSADRQPYAIGFINYAAMLRSLGKTQDSDALMASAVDFAPTVFGR